MGKDEISRAKCKCLLESKNIDLYWTKCQIHLDEENFNYYCSNCNSNFCDKCYKFHKVIFKDNILNFDGYFSKSGEKHGFGITYKRNNEKNYEGFWTNNKFKYIDTIPHSHEKMSRWDLIKEFKFDICSKNCDFFYTGMFCWECDLNICDLCIIEINKKNS